MEVCTCVILTCSSSRRVCLVSAQQRTPERVSHGNDDRLDGGRICPPTLGFSSMRRTVQLHPFGVLPSASQLLNKCPKSLQAASFPEPTVVTPRSNKPSHPNDPTSPAPKKQEQTLLPSLQPQHKIITPQQIVTQERSSLGIEPQIIRLVLPKAAL